MATTSSSEPERLQGGAVVERGEKVQLAAVLLEFRSHRLGSFAVPISCSTILALAPGAQHVRGRAMGGLRSHLLVNFESLGGKGAPVGCGPG
jgi:hypothetical protein